MSSIDALFVLFGGTADEQDHEKDTFRSVGYRYDPERALLLRDAGRAGNPGRPG